MAMNLHKGDNVNRLHSKVIDTIPYIFKHRLSTTINMETITIYKLIQKLTKFDSNCKVLIRNNELYIINPNTTTVDDKDIEEYENYINSVENQDSIY